jgi:integrase/recombinase XerD
MLLLTIYDCLSPIREMMDKVSKGTLARERGCIVRFFNWLYVEEYIGRDPGGRVVERIKVPKRQQRGIQ